MGKISRKLSIFLLTTHNLSTYIFREYNTLTLIKILCARLKKIVLSAHNVCSHVIKNCSLRKHLKLGVFLFKGELQRENKLISYERAFKMLENDMYIAGIGQVVLELLSFKVESGNHQRGISLLQKFSDIFGNMRLVPLKMTSHLTSHNFQI